jgi:hypothetical protein
MDKENENSSFISAPSSEAALHMTTQHSIHWPCGNHVFQSHVAEGLYLINTVVVCCISVNIGHTSRKRTTHTYYTTIIFSYVTLVPVAYK